MKSFDFKIKKATGKKITVLTCYDYPSAKIASETPLDCLLVGDSVAMTVHGMGSTIHATMEMMILHTAAVSRGLGKQFLMVDMPFLSYQGSLSTTVTNVQRLMQAGAHGIKLEGGDPRLYQTISHLVACGIVVIGHIGLTPQHLHHLGGYRVQGRDTEQANQLLVQAQSLEKAGVHAIVLECIPHTLATKITQTLTIPTIGIGSGPNTDGQVLVWHDVFGLQTELQPRFVKQYSQLKPSLTQAIHDYHEEVQTAMFPTSEHCYE